MSLIECKENLKIKNKLNKFLLKVKKDQDRRITKLTKKIMNPSLTKGQMEDLILEEFNIQFFEKRYLFGDGGKERQEPKWIALSSKNLTDGSDK